MSWIGLALALIFVYILLFHSIEGANQTRISGGKRLETTKKNPKGMVVSGVQGLKLLMENQTGGNNTEEKHPEEGEGNEAGSIPPVVVNNTGVGGNNTGGGGTKEGPIQKAPVPEAEHEYFENDIIYDLDEGRPQIRKKVSGCLTSHRIVMKCISSNQNTFMIDGFGNEAQQEIVCSHLKNIHRCFEDMDRKCSQKIKNIQNKLKRRLDFLLTRNRGFCKFLNSGCPRRVIVSGRTQILLLFLSTFSIFFISLE
ncbi:unnamed protein product [Lepeophtheirus salmonis]|uniref:(salmon louse) hypothetical protein n=2 Tax=Lepeophtheirus salmonis TaxID=72036 RepID=A0A7R8H079_LEPSM|nr:unnamed protein product [Lepeophtheirus salmonis]CAF2764764.1 unnamed protein product [Lepeophtheirus salmonis]